MYEKLWWTHWAQCNRNKRQWNSRAAGYLYTGLCQFGPLCQLLSSVDIRVVCPLKGLLQLLQLLCSEGGATAPLFPLQGQVWLRIHIRAFIHTAPYYIKKQQELRLRMAKQWIRQKYTLLAETCLVHANYVEIDSSTENYWYSVVKSSNRLLSIVNEHWTTL